MPIRTRARTTHTAMRQYKAHNHAITHHATHQAPSHPSRPPSRARALPNPAVALSTADRRSIGHARDRPYGGVESRRVGPDVRRRRPSTVIRRLSSHASTAPYRHRTPSHRPPIVVVVVAIAIAIASHGYAQSHPSSSSSRSRSHLYARHEPISRVHASGVHAS